MKKKWNRFQKFGFSLMAVIGLSAVLVGCSDDAKDDKGTTGEKSSGKETETIRLVAANHPWTEAITPLLSDFEEETGITVKVDSYFEDQLSQKTSVEFAANAKSIDVVLFRPLQDGKQFEKNGYFASLNDYVSKEGNSTDDYVPSALGSVKNGDNLYGLPVITESTVLYYRKDILEKAGLQPPKTLDELKEQAEKLNDPENGIIWVCRTREAFSGGHSVFKLPLQPWR